MAKSKNIFTAIPPVPVISLSVDLNVTMLFPSHKARVRKIVDSCDLIKFGLLSLQAQKPDHACAGSLEVIKFYELIQAVNPLFPRDSFSVATAACFLSSRAHFDAESYQSFRELLPEYTGSWSRKIVANDMMFSLEFYLSPKHSGSSYIFRFTRIEQHPANHTVGLFLPFDITVEGFADMDNMENHHDECDGNCCECETFMTRSSTLTLTSKMWDKKNGKKLVKNWIEKAMFEQMS